MYGLCVGLLERSEARAHGADGVLTCAPVCRFVTMPHAYALNFSKYAPKLNFAQNMYALFATE